MSAHLGPGVWLDQREAHVLYVQFVTPRLRQLSGTMPAKVAEIVETLRQASSAHQASLDRNRIGTSSQVRSGTIGSDSEGEAGIFVTVRDAAMRLGTSERWVTELCNATTLDAKRHGRRWLIYADSLAAFEEDR